MGTDRSGDGAMNFVACLQVADFGLSRQASSSTVDTDTYGTVTHMPPELLMEGKLSKAADVYAFGVLLWEMYTGSVSITLFMGMIFLPPYVGPHCVNFQELFDTMCYCSLCCAVYFVAISCHVRADMCCKVVCMMQPPTAKSACFCLFLQSLGIIS